MSIVVENLTKVYGQQQAISQVSFQALPGEIVGFLGPNGAGKSTTMKIATGYIPPTSGTVKVCGFDVSNQPMEVQQNIGYLPEHNPLYLDMYVAEYLTFIAGLHQLGRKSLTERLAMMIDLCGLEAEKHKKIGALSKGYRQRVGLAQALLHDPPVLILDEPTTGLDPNQIVEIRNLIKTIGKAKTVVFSTHIMQEVEAICDRAVIINKGKIVADSPVSALRELKTGKKTIVVEFQNTIQTKILQSLPGVAKVHQEAEATATYTIEQKNSQEDLRAAISTLAAQQGWILLGMKQEETSLENIFRELTLTA